MHYTFVLTPPRSEYPKYVQASQKLCASFNPKYLLNDEGTSSPHITLVQFDATEQVAQKVWSDFSQAIKKQEWKPFVPSFVGVSFIPGEGEYEGTTWVEWMVSRGGKGSSLMRAHEQAVGILGKHGIKPLNSVLTMFRPHLTMGRITMPLCVPSWSKEDLNNGEPFSLEFGVSDDQW